jgi:undecaprenyl-diphosphatase
VSHLTFAEAMVVGLVQGVTELFPISSLGHNVLIPAWVGGSWARDLNVSRAESPYLAFIVGMHVATAIAMIIYFWRDWVRIIGGFFTSLRHRRIETPDQRLAWMIIVATIPVGIAGLALEHLFRVVFAKPIVTSVFLAVNGLVLFGGWRLSRREAPRSAQPTEPLAGAPQAAPAGHRAGYVTADGASAGGTEPAGQFTGQHSGGRRALRQQEADDAIETDRRLASIGYVQAFVLGAIQVFALLPGISRDGVVMVGGMLRGLPLRDAARFSFLLSAPVILAAGALKIPDLAGTLGNGVRGQILAGSVLSGVGAYFALVLFMRWVRKSSGALLPFAVYCFLVGIGSLIYLSVR